MDLFLEKFGVVVQYLGGIFNDIRRQLWSLNVKSINKIINKYLYIKIEFSKTKPQKGEEETSKTKGKKIVAISQKMKYSNKHWKQYDVCGHMDEKCKKLHLKLRPIWYKSNNGTCVAIKEKQNKLERTFDVNEVIVNMTW